MKTIALCLIIGFVWLVSTLFALYQGFIWGRAAYHPGNFVEVPLCETSVYHEKYEVRRCWVGAELEPELQDDILKEYK